MRILLEKKYAKFLDGEKKRISLKEFFENFAITNCIENENFQIIVDHPGAFEFSIDRLAKSTILDAYDHLKCRRKILSKNECAFLAQNESLILNFFKEKEYKIQRVTLLDDDLLKVAEYFCGVIPIEFLILDFCKKIEKLEENAWWLYIAIHCGNEIRIIAGQGNALLLSRSINFSHDPKQILRELQNSLRFLRRFGLESDVKIITPIKDLKLYDQEIAPIDLEKISDNLHFPIPNDIEECILNYSYNIQKNRRIFGGKSDLKKYFLKNFTKFTISISFLLVVTLGYLFYLFWNISKLNEEIILLKNYGVTQECSSENFDLTVNDKSFAFAQNIFKNFQSSENPVIALDKICEFVDENKIDVENLSVKNLRDAELKTKLIKKTAEKLKKSHKKVEIKLIENQNINGYEELNGKFSDNKQGAIVCLNVG